MRHMMSCSPLSKRFCDVTVLFIDMVSERVYNFDRIKGVSVSMANCPKGQDAKL